MKPKVSIVTPLHNKGAYVAETIESVLAQTMRDWEMIVVENYSTDDGPQIALGFSQRDARVRFVEAPPEVRGPGAARNCGLAQARGEWILFLDADDLLEPDYLARRLEVLGNYPEAEIIAGPWKSFRDESPGVLEDHLPDGWRPPFGPPGFSVYAYSPWVLHAAIVRRKILGDAPWLPELDRFHAEDNAFWFRTVYGKTIFWDNGVGALYRTQTKNSRDATAVDANKALGATIAMLEANRSFLQSRGRRPSGAMATTAVRVLENLLPSCGGNDQLNWQVHRQISLELRDAPWMESSMLARRMLGTLFFNKLRAKLRELKGMLCYREM
jgi:hypothetical protein